MPEIIILSSLLIAKLLTLYLSTFLLIYSIKVLIYIPLSLSQIFIELSLLPDIIYLSSLLIVRQVTYLLCPSKTLTKSPLFRSQILIVLSKLPDII